ncbi:MAG: KEOPS complex subunit Pcc1 [Halobacteriales archaeon]
MNETTVRTVHADATAVAAAVGPDNTPEVRTRVEGDAVVTTIERETLGGLRATLEDYLRALAVADETVRLVRATDNVDP